ncbi:MAG: carboxypeptidase M32 [Alicyclobacillaceae bacterium]|nr:carboxypeptidase M32 [Alicyclobacillaceae bacterium]MCY0896246.1 carboxypeptidase M32 [Alicyclobacillaceae bacterium]
MTLAKTLQAFRDLLKKTDHFMEARRLMEWDLRTGAPRQGHALRAEAMGTVADEIFRLQTSPELAAMLAELGSARASGELSAADAALVRVVQDDYDRDVKIPSAKFHEYVVLAAQAQSVWVDAKKASNFSLLRPYLERLVALKKEFIDYWGWHGHRYNALMHAYEPGLTVAELDPVFASLRDETVQLLQRIGEKGFGTYPETLKRPVPVPLQHEFGLAMLRKIGYDFQSGRVDETAHPFETTINRFDVRVTTKYVEDDVLNALYSTLHEGGHALYEQNISTDFVNTPLSQGASMGIHESQSRFVENMLGRSREFWEAAFPEFHSAFADLLDHPTLEDVYRAANHVKPSLIRIDADELTYNLHIMIRYELEKGLFDGQHEVGDLPRLWTEKMQDYLGITPPDDAHGVLQDVHWSAGDFGYFPTYALGNLYAAQFRHALLRDLPDYHDCVRAGEIAPIREWLTEHIHRHGRMLMPTELVEQASGEPLDSKYLVAYLTEKMTEIYEL